MVEKDWRERAYEKYDSTHLGNVQKNTKGYNKIKIKDYIEQIGIKKNEKIIDLGCGKGQLIESLIEEGILNCKGIDLSIENIDTCKNKNLNVTQGDILKKDILKEKYDVVFLFDIVEHLYKNEFIELLDNLWGVLEENGRVVIKTINASNVLSARDKYMDLTHVTSFTEYSAMQIAKICNFKFHKVLNEKPVTFKNKIRIKLNRIIHVILYRLNGGKIPENTEREFIFIYKK